MGAILAAVNTLSYASHEATVPAMVPLGHALVTSLRRLVVHCRSGPKYTRALAVHLAELRMIVRRLTNLHKAHWP
jgi:hypothetical protein